MHSVNFSDDRLREIGVNTHIGTAFLCRFHATAYSCDAHVSEKQSIALKYQSDSRRNLYNTERKELLIVNPQHAVAKNRHCRKQSKKKIKPTGLSLCATDKQLPTF